MPQKLWAPGLLIAGDGAGLVNVPALKGIHYAIESGRLAAEAAWRALAREGRSGWLPSYDEALRSSFVWRDLRKVRNMRRRSRTGSGAARPWRGSRRRPSAATPPATGRRERDASHDDDHDRPRGVLPRARRVLTFDKLSSVFLSGNRTRDDQPNHVRIQTRVPEELGEHVGADVPGGGLRGRSRAKTASSR